MESDAPLLSGADLDSALAGNGPSSARSKQKQKHVPTSSDGDHVDPLAAAALQERKKERLTILRVIIVLLVVGVIVIGLVYAVSPKSRGAPPPNASECAIQCSGTILQTVQFSGLFNDSKTFVDMPLLFDPEVVIQDFNAMTDYSQARCVEKQRMRLGEGSVEEGAC